MPESNEPSSEVHKSEGERSAAAVDASQKIISALIEAVQKGEIQGGRVGGQIIKYEKNGVPDFKRTSEFSGYHPLDRSRVFSGIGADTAIAAWEYRNRLANQFGHLLFKHPYEEKSGTGSGGPELGSLSGDPGLIEKIQTVYDQLLDDLRFLRENNPSINRILEERRERQNR